MKKIFKTIILIIILGIVQRIYFKDYFIDGGLISSLITFLSIVFGFYITSLTVFSTSKFVSGLYKIKDRGNRSFSLLNTLINNYKHGLILILLTIIYLLTTQFLLSKEASRTLSLSNAILFPFFGLITINFWYSYKLLDDLIKVTLQEAKNFDK